MTSNNKIQLRDFINEIKSELVSLETTGKESPYFVIGDIELEARFNVEVSGNASAKFWVVEAGGETRSSDTHSVKINMKVIPPDQRKEFHDAIGSKSEVYNNLWGGITVAENVQDEAITKWMENLETDKVQGLANIAAKLLNPKKI